MDNLLSATTPTKNNRYGEQDEAPQPRNYQMQPAALRSNVFSSDQK